MKDTLQRLLKITEGCREDMHEPDEDIKAKITGNHLDNAFGDSGEYGEFCVHITRDSYRYQVQKFNLATLIALARKAKLDRRPTLNDEALFCLKQIINDLPSKRDWLDPVVEKMARKIIADAEGK